MGFLNWRSINYMMERTPDCGNRFPGNDVNLHEDMLLHTTYLAKMALCHGHTIEPATPAR